MDLETRKKIARTMKGHSNFEGHKHTHATKLQIGISQEGHRNVKDHKWVVNKETGKTNRVKGALPKGTKWGRSRSSTNEAVWDNPSPNKNSDKLSPAMKARAKARAKAAGRPYPNMIDNMWAAKNEETMLDKIVKLVNEARAKATYCGRCGTTHVPPGKGGTCPALRKEEVEQVNELSRATLGSYVKKATSDVRTNTNMARDYDNRSSAAPSPTDREVANKLSTKHTVKAWKRQDNIGKAVDRLTAEGKEDIPFDGPYSKAKPDNVKDKSGAVHTPMSRARHLARMALKSKKQRTDNKEMNEVSKATLGSYIEKAHQSIVDTSTASSFKSGAAGDKYNKADETPSEAKRLAGIKRAIKKLQK